ncbi:MAG: hypothetical protein NTZ33_15020 [Bacteroidetes bacterium]|nr:hypothetical protein [Bacteroidota bacterium]
MSKLIFFVVVLVILSFFSCKKEQDYPIIPTIEYKEFLYDNSQQQGFFIFKFTDGDGDIGLKQNDTYPPYDTSSYYYNNFFIHVYERINGVYKPFVLFNPTTQQNDTIVFKYRIPYITPVSINGSLKGELQTQIDVGLMLPYLHSDTIQFEAFIFDRQLHKSNIIRTPDIRF